MSEPKSVILLPCHHMSVCLECFSHSDKCPVCRAPYDSHVFFDHKDSEENREIIAREVEEDGTGQLSVTDDESISRGRSLSSTALSRSPSSTEAQLNPLHQSTHQQEDSEASRLRATSTGHVVDMAALEELQRL